MRLQQVICYKLRIPRKPVEPPTSLEQARERYSVLREFASNRFDIPNALSTEEFEYQLERARNPHDGIFVIDGRTNVAEVLSAR